MHPSLVALAQLGRINVCDVEHVQSSVFPHGLTGREEAESLLALDLAAYETCDEWQDFVISAIAAFVTRADGITEDDADWLVSCLSRNGVVDSEFYFEILFTAIAYGRIVPFSLSRLAMDQIGLAAFEMRGPLADRRLQQVSGLRMYDVSLIREILTASEPAGRPGISREEMAQLYSINERSVCHPTDPTWHDLFVKAAANYVLSSRADLSQSRSFALAPASADPSEDVKRTCLGTLHSLERVNETCSGAEDMIRIVGRYQERGLIDETEQDADLLGACLKQLKTMSMQPTA